jgi:preprotein translocase subunit SecB
MSKKDKTTEEELDGPLMAISRQFIKDLSFENPKGNNSFLQIEEEPDLNVEIQVQNTPLPDNSFEIELYIKAEAKTKKMHLYLLELNYAGVFTLGNIPEEIIKPILFIECPRLLFPFARNIIAQVTGESGFPPLLLSPFDFVSLYQSQMAGEESPFQQPAGNA